MGVVHFLNVKDGDCHIIQHPSGHTTVIDISNASSTEDKNIAEGTEYVAKSLGILGNYNQKAKPTNPVNYLRNKGITSIFRYIQTHPDMDHMDGIKDLFGEFSPTNFWDTENSKEMSGDFGPYSEADWKFYRRLRDEDSSSDPKRLTLFSGAKGAFYNQDENGSGGGDGLKVLSPTRELLSQANETEEWNDSSYVILYRTGGRKIVFPGDAHDNAWEHLIKMYPKSLADVDILIAPHHGRDSEMDFSFLDTLRPKLSLLGNAKSKHLAYDKWQSRKLAYVTNNQAGDIIVDSDEGEQLSIYVSNFSFANDYARSIGSETEYSTKHDAWSLLSI